MYLYANQDHIAPATGSPRDTLGSAFAGGRVALVGDVNLIVTHMLLHYLAVKSQYAILWHFLNFLWFALHLGSLFGSNLGR